ncbi:MAG: FadR family transcriptional regulator [Thermomicrobiales bacterium]|nr:FadR family transcriptional regulator [Thermomicrobiales bacterium]
MDLRPVARETLATSVMKQLLEYIRDRPVEPGEALPSQDKLAAQLRVSRPILREAMQGLASLGLLEIRPGSGCYVRQPEAPAGVEALLGAYTHEAAIEVLEARLAIEVEAAGLAAARRTAGDLERLGAILERIRVGVEQAASTVEVTSEFHEALMQAAHNAVLARLGRLLRQPIRIGTLRIEHAMPEAMEHEYDHHRVIFEAIAAADADRARRVMREHLTIAHGREHLIALRHQALLAPDQHQGGLPAASP